MGNPTEERFLPRASLAAELAGALRSQIGRGRFAVGERLPSESELMRRYGVGRSTVREAVRMLVDAGLLRVRQGAGTFVERLNDDTPMDRRMRRADLRDLDEVRGILESAAARLAAARHTEADAALIVRRLAGRGEAAASGTLETAIEADIAFHAAVAGAAHNDLLGELYRTVADYLHRGFRSRYEGPESFLVSQPLHEELCRALLRRDGGTAARLTAEIVEDRLTTDTERRDGR